MAKSDDQLMTHSQLVKEFEALGVAPGQIVMAHASVKSIGRIMGGPNVVVAALLEALTSTGTLMMYADWEDIPDFVLDLGRRSSSSTTQSIRPSTRVSLAPCATTGFWRRSCAAGPARSGA